MTTATVARDLEAYLQRSGGPPMAIETVVPFGDGHSGHTYLVTASGRGSEPTRYVLRTSAPGQRPVGPADIGRQGRIMAALHAAGLPAPRVLASSSALDVDGRSFALLDFVDGVGWEEYATSHSHRDVAVAAVGVLHRLRGLPLEHVGLGGEAVISPTDEIDRWAGLIDRSDPTIAASARSFASALRETTPAPGPPGLVHGDFHYGNLMFDQSGVVAVVDWEIASIGQPLLDLGCLAVASMRSRYAPDPNPTGSVDVSLEELIALYGADPGEARWYAALSCFRYAVILAYNLRLHRTGRRPDAVYEELVTTMHGLAVDGQHLLTSRGR